MFMYLHDCRSTTFFGYYDRGSLFSRLTFTMKSSKSPEELKRDARIKLWSVRAVRLAVVLGCTG